MTFRNIALLFFIFWALTGCKGLEYYQSGTNPAGVSVILRVPDQFYSNIETTDKIIVGVINHNSQSITLNEWWDQFTMIGQSRFYQKELTMKYTIPENIKTALKIEAGDTLLLFSAPIKDFLNQQKGWNFKSKPSLGPHLINKTKTYPYIYLTGELKTNVLNQDAINIRSNTQRINVGKWVEPKLVNKKTELSISSNVAIFNTKEQLGNISCKITNTSEYPIPLFNDAGSVRFRIFAYGPNRTSIMYTQYILDNGKLPIEPVSIASKSTYTVTVELKQLLFTERPDQAKLFWTWNKKKPPISPLVYGKKDLATSTEFWFGVVVDGQEFLSNTLTISIDSSNKKANKKN